MIGPTGVRLALALAAMNACAPKPSTDGTSVDPPVCAPDDEPVHAEVVDGACMASLGIVWPAQEAEDVALDASLLAIFFDERAKEDVTWRLLDPEDHDVPLGTALWSEDGRLAELRPVTPLRPSTTYRWARCLACGTTGTTTFTTAAVAPIADPRTLVGRTYVLDLEDTLDVGAARDPGIPTLAALAEQALETRFVLLTPRSWSPDGRNLAVDVDSGRRSGETWSQDACRPTQHLELHLGEDGSVAGSAAPFPFLSRVGQVNVPSVSLGAAFGNDGASLVGLDVRIIVDTPTIRDALSWKLDDQDCALADLSEGRLSCEPCPDGAGATCFGLRFVAGTAESVEGLTTTPRTVEQIEGDDACDRSGEPGPT